MQYFLDTSVILYAAGAQHEYKKSCATIIEQIAREELSVCISTEVLHEIVHRYTRLSKKQEGIKIARDISELVQVLPVDDVAFLHALTILEQCEVDTRDAVHAAVVLHFGISHIISADKHFERIKEVTRIDPTALI
ncbi:MAG: putative ribonuclease VapC [Parcubacteria group bacterium GW2011_GWC2_45_7]|uniref:Ribonuclease VapC n=1 Tax=Candidatus Magasanikbacteria bacterium GW2011_GWA2_50_22 TaxID=1619043 RepID=A0A0G1WFI5_9BACT|nr:MAG: putative ribonuclease VapC [Parcubacteria group bacterium GW2011_GWC2_45_7]KKW17548.1 MAG: putative ribonuclease VapC [Candidatus Magasanikbacteria bacterium GW2011_GWA2_50_22]